MKGVGRGGAVSTESSVKDRSPKSHIAKRNKQKKTTCVHHYHLSKDVLHQIEVPPKGKQKQQTASSNGNIPKAPQLSELEFLSLQTNVPMRQLKESQLRQTWLAQLASQRLPKRGKDVETILVAKTKKKPFQAIAQTRVNEPIKTYRSRRERSA